MHQLLANSYSGTLKFLQPTIEKYGVDVDSTLVEAGIDMNKFNSIYKRIPCHLSSKYVDLIVKKSSPIVAIKACEHLNPAIFQSFGTGLLFSKSLTDFCHRYVNGFAFISSAINVNFIQDSFESYLTFDENTYLNEVNSNFYSDIFAALTLKFIKLMIGADFKAKKVCLSWTPDDYMLQEYIDYFGENIEFSADKTKIVFDYNSLDVELPFANEKLAKQSDKMVVEFLKRSSAFNFTSKVSNIILKLLLNGNCSKLNVAEICGISERTLNNKLNAEGTNFKSIVEKIRKSYSIYYLQEGNLTPEQLAFKLGYCNYGNFSRAFKAWYGVSPLHYKNDHKKGILLAS
ncbi:helix-turn-helix domain-containing protein [Thalassotalea psychrophila]|uniref:Helix-turn-helix domain-containing protein n=1 Tax=Thalassotalea psychrophila TaxID=3065647 RepID=A0ABY9TNL4_9GAMM|nr:helix-turn-helix domain-containing protein [Colwelliaceae bacterium SQ149]